jgi:hypothetical protein
MKKVREEITEYWHDEESGRVIVKIEERRLISVKDGEERWETQYKSIPII